MEKKQAPPYPLRMPPELRDRLERAAASKKRSLNAEIIDLLESAGEGPSTDAGLQSLVADLARAKQEKALLVFSTEQKLLNLVMLYDIYLDAMAAAKALGIRTLLPKRNREMADYIGSEADDEFKRHDELYDPMVLFGGVAATDEEFKAAQAKLATILLNAPRPTEADAIAMQSLREKILNRSRRKFLPVDTSPEAEAKRAEEKSLVEPKTGLPKKVTSTKEDNGRAKS